MYKTLTLARDRKGIAHLTLDRPEKHNAMSGQMLDELVEACGELGTDASTRVVVLTGAGKSFCAGGDLEWMRAQFGMDAETRKAESAKVAGALKALDTLPQPLIARVQGHAFGGGSGLLCVCDSVIAADTVRFGFTETRLGLIPANIGPFVLRRIGVGAARRVLTSARIFDAHEAQKIGLVSSFVAPDMLEAAVEAEIAPYLSVAPGAVAETKALMRDLGYGVSDVDVAKAVSALAARWETEEAQRGISAFLDKRPAPWMEDA